MYLVELRPGKEELYRTTEELAAAIRKGDVDAQSRIYHRATSKWISVTLHPQFKAIIAERSALPPLERTNWTFFNDSADDLAGASPEAGEAGEPTESDPTPADPSAPWRRPLALSITGGLLILGLQLAASGPKPPWAAAEARAEPAGVILPAAAVPVPAAVSPTISLVNNSSVTGGASWVELNRGYVSSSSSSEGPAITADSEPPAPALPAAPKIRTKALLKAAIPAVDPAGPASSGPAEPTVRAFVARWTAAHDSALSRLESGVRVARLSQLFASSRLSPGGGLTETRLSLAGVANFVRIYRQQQVAIERQFQDSFTATSKARKWSPTETKLWYARPGRTDSPALASLTASLMDGIDSLLGVLDAQAGTYAVTKNTIRFEDPSAAREYMALRERILLTVDSAKVAGGNDHPGPMNYLLQAIGTTRLPLAS